MWYDDSHCTTMHMPGNEGKSVQETHRHRAKTVRFAGNIVICLVCLYHNAHSVLIVKCRADVCRCMHGAYKNDISYALPY